MHRLTGLLLLPIFLAGCAKTDVTPAAQAITSMQAYGRDGEFHLDSHGIKKITYTRNGEFRFDPAVYDAERGFVTETPAQAAPHPDLSRAVLAISRPDPTTPITVTVTIPGVEQPFTYKASAGATTIALPVLDTTTATSCQLQVVASGTPTTIELTIAARFQEPV